MKQIKKFVVNILCGLMVVMLLPVSIVYFTDAVSTEIYAQDGNQSLEISVEFNQIFIDEGQTAYNTIFVSNAGPGLTIECTHGIVSDNGDGTWAWSYNVPSGVGGIVHINIYANDATGGATAYFPLFVNRVPSSEEILARIDLGLSWLVGEQKEDGSWNGPYEYIIIDEPVACTGLILTKLCDYAYENGYNSPFDVNYEYHQNVIAGYDYLFSKARSRDNGTTIFMHADLTDPHHETYNASIALMGIAASLTPDRIIDYPDNILVDGLTFMQLANKIVLYFENSQRSNPDDNSCGGWSYNDIPDGRADNSNSGYVVLGLRYAEAFGCVIPEIIKTRLSEWIDFIQNDTNGGSGYNDPNSGVNMLETGNLLFEMAFVGDNTSTPRVQHALEYITNVWASNGSNPDYFDQAWLDKDIQMLYCLMKGFESLSIDFIDVNGEDINWFDKFITQLYYFNFQDVSGYWIFSWYGDRLLNTCWALFILEKVVPPPPNQPPNITSIILPTDPVAISDQPINVTVTYEDPDHIAGDSYTVTFDFSDGVTETSSTTELFYTGQHTFQEPGVYTVTVTVIDKHDGSDTKSAQTFIVIYNPADGFITGGGWIDSPYGAYVADPSLTGKANFGFVSKYKKGQTTPDGNTEFQFKAADLNFHSGSYEWLVITNAKAMYKGVGTINGAGNYGFQLSAIDAELTPSTDVDLFRIRIWDKDNYDMLVYDNKVGEDDPHADPNTALADGSIKIHKNGLKKENSEDGIDGLEIPEHFSLWQNYPNPFNPSTTIQYEIPQVCHIELSIYNVSGQLIEIIETGNREPGQYRCQWNASRYSNGIYFYKITAGDFIQIGKMILMK